MGDRLQTASLRESAHLAVERERGEFSAAVVVGNQAVEQAAARAGVQGGKYARPVQRRHQTAPEHDIGQGFDILQARILSFLSLMAVV